MTGFFLDDFGGNVFYRFVSGHLGKLGIQIKLISFFPVKIISRVVAFYLASEPCFKFFGSNY